MRKNKIELIVALSVILILAILGMTQSKKINFLLTTKVMFPLSAYDIRYASDFGGMGDGESELSFKVSDTDQTKFLTKKPFGQEWSSGPYSGVESGEISVLSESHQITNGDSLKYSIKYKNPENVEYDKSYTLLVIDTETNTILLKTSNF